VRIAVAAIAALGLYGALGFWGAPQLVRSLASDFVRENYSRELQLRSVRINPFLLQLEASGIALPERLR